MTPGTSGELLVLTVGTRTLRGDLKAAEYELVHLGEAVSTEQGWSQAKFSCHDYRLGIRTFSF